MNKHLKNIVIVGGGTAGWMAAAALAKTVNREYTKITLVESTGIGSVGVGEATIPPIINFLKYLDIDEMDFIRSTGATYKLGIKFDDWLLPGQSYMHPFGSVGVRIDGKDFFSCWRKVKAKYNYSVYTDFSPAAAMCVENRFYPPQNADKDSFLAGASYALHFDAARVADYLKQFSMNLGVERIEGEVSSVRLDRDGFIDSLNMIDGSSVRGDFYIDCSGFKGLLIEEALKTGYDNWQNYLPCDRAITVQTESDVDFPPYTLATAKDCGWTWKIPLQNRTGNGYVYSSRHCSDEDALSVLMASVSGKPMGEPKLIPFVTGKRKKIWNKNCLSLGLASGFIEPLESTAIHLVTKGLRAFLDMLPTSDYSDALVNEYNRIVAAEYECIRDFIVLHYCTTQREDSSFWRECREMTVPQSLSQKIDLFRERGVLYFNPSDLFKEPSWHCVFEGMGIEAKSYDPTVDYIDSDKIQNILGQVADLMKKMALGLPTHKAFLGKVNSLSKT